MHQGDDGSVAPKRKRPLSIGVDRQRYAKTVTAAAVSLQNAILAYWT
jgi:hypothetical protein